LSQGGIPPALATSASLLENKGLTRLDSRNGDLNKQFWPGLFEANSLQYAVAPFVLMLTLSIAIALPLDGLDRKPVVRNENGIGNSVVGSCNMPGKRAKKTS
jgi:hypothetical protein